MFEPQRIVVKRFPTISRALLGSRAHNGRAPAGDPGARAGPRPDPGPARGGERIPPAGSGRSCSFVEMVN